MKISGKTKFCLSCFFVFCFFFLAIPKFIFTTFCPVHSLTFFRIICFIFYFLSVALSVLIINRSVLFLFCCLSATSFSFPIFHWDPVSIMLTKDAIISLFNISSVMLNFVIFFVLLLFDPLQNWLHFCKFCSRNFGFLNIIAEKHNLPIEITN